jgi:hypothetical protein
MNTQAHADCSSTGFTRIELIVLIAILAFVAFMGLSALSAAKCNANSINCINYLKQVGLSFRLWAGDNYDRMPMQVSTNAGGTMELVAGGTVAPHFLVMSNELESPANLICPGDKAARVSENWNSLTDANLSYFVVPEADEAIPKMWLSGDSNLTTNEIRLKSGVVAVSESLKLSWTTKRHWKVDNLVFADGSVEPLLNLRLQEYATNVLRTYREATTNVSFRIVIP